MTTKNLVPFADYTISEGGVTASLELNYDRDSEKYEWFLSHERTSKYYDPHINIYMVFKW